ncbi:MAG: MurR/RpiR family transcriptional regulator [Thomasclavelia sp.]
MYTIERLQNLVEYVDVDSVERILAEYFLANLNNLSSLTLKQCAKITGVSKASINRFYIHGGFSNFKELVTALKRELMVEQVFLTGYKLENDNLDISNKDLENLCNCLIKAKYVMFYGDQVEINCLDNLKYLLIKAGIKVLSLNLWNMDMVNYRIERLSKDDVLIVVDSSLRIQNMFEMSMNRSNLLNFEKLKDPKFHCFYIGNSNCDSYFGFKNLKIKNNLYQLNLLSYELINILKKKGY